MTEFLDAFHSYLVPGSPVLLFDELDVPTRTVGATRFDAAGNRYEIIKNFFDADELRSLLSRHGRDIQYEALAAIWLVTYRT